MAIRLFLICSLLITTAAASPISLEDDSGRTVQLDAPAVRIVSLAPHITELLFAAGAGEHIVGVGSYSDYPAEARVLPQIGSYNGIDYEGLLALQPDLVIAWQSGNGMRIIERLRHLGLNVFVSEPRELSDIPRTITQFGELAGTAAEARAAAQDFEQRLLTLTTTHAGLPTMRVFYQIWNAPLMTVNGQQIISQVIQLCGGENVFARLPSLAPQIGLEAVLAANPEVIIASEVGEQAPPWLYDWRKWPQLRAVQQDNLFFIPSDLIQRHSPRLLDGAELLCSQLELARQRRDSSRLSAPRSTPARQRPVQSPE